MLAINGPVDDIDTKERLRDRSLNDIDNNEWLRIPRNG
jgi:hypothetical protein